MATNLACDKFWVNKTMYHDAEKKYYENLTKLQRSGQNYVETLGGKNKENNKKIKENKKVQLKIHKNLSNHLDIDALRKELINLEAKNAKNESFNNKCDSNKKDCFEILKRKEENTLEKSEDMIDSEKKVKKKEVKEKKNKTEKKSKRMKDKEENTLGGVGIQNLNQDAFPKTSLAGEVAKARQHIKTSLEYMDQSINGGSNIINSRLTVLLEKMETSIQNLTKRVEILEKKCASCPPLSQIVDCPPKTQISKAKSVPPTKVDEDEDEDVDLFGSESEEDEESKRIREQRLAEYAAKKSKKPALVAKSNIILDIKPWDDETDMKEMEKAVRAIEMDGLVWGASKLVPVAFKIFKLQISCVIEDDKVSVDVLTETLESIEDYIQSVDIAAFNKV